MNNTKGLHQAPCLSERGASMIELLYVIVIIGVLSMISLTGYAMYREDAEYAKAESTLRNARTAFEVGDQEAPEGLTIPATFSDTVGGPVAGPLATLLPGAKVSKDVRLGAAYTYCDPGVDPVTVKQLLISQPCRSSRYTTWLKLCNGTEISQHDLPLPPGTC